MKHVYKTLLTIKYPAECLLSKYVNDCSDNCNYWVSRKRCKLLWTEKKKCDIKVNLLLTKCHTNEL
jgi:collagenase-like PrtC family protease